MAAPTPAWPESLKEFVNVVFSKCTESNRQRVQEELKKKIYDAMQEDRLNTTDWANVTLESLQKPGKRKISSITSPSFEDLDLRDRRKRRFANNNSHRPASRLASSDHQPDNNFDDEDTQMNDVNLLDWDRHTIRGTSMKLEKHFLRLTTVPDPSTIRPPEVLEKALDMVIQKWRTENNYGYCCDQLKSIRQDLTVQRIRDQLTVRTYEVHARVALEKCDLGEYNQCQTQLWDLYKHKLGGRPMEFLAYRILYFLHTRNRSEINSLLSSLTSEQRADPGVKHALEVRKAMAANNYRKLFQLFQTAPNMGGYVMDNFIDRERLMALMIMTKGYTPGLEVSYIASILGFSQIHELITFLSSCSALVYKSPPTGPSDQGILDCKAAFSLIKAKYDSSRKVDIKGQI